MSGPGVNPANIGSREGTLTYGGTAMPQGLDDSGGGSGSCGGLGLLLLDE